MGALPPFVHTVSAAAASALVMGVVEGVVLTAVVAGLLRLCPGLSAGLRSAIWTLALTISVLLPAGSLLRTHDVAASGRRAAEVGEGWALALVLLWAILSSARLAILAAGVVRLREVWRRAVPITAGAGTPELLEAGGRRAELCVSDDVDRPSVVGFLRPRVLLPAALLAKLTPEEIEPIVQHEMEHLERRDDWTNLAQKLSLALFPLNPVLFWLDRRLSEERELACDDAVLRRTGAPKTYAACLANLAESRLSATGISGQHSSLALGAWSRETELSRRVHRILSWRETAARRRTSAFAAGALILGVAAGGLELARCPQLLRFTSEPVNLAEVGQSSGTEAVGAVPSGPGVPMGVRTLARVGGSAAARPVLLKAILPEPLGSPTAFRPANSRHAARSRSRHGSVGSARASKRWPAKDQVTQPIARHALRDAQSPRVVMTAWSTDQPPARLIFTVAGEDAPAGLTRFETQRFAAFATRDGWLFLQL